MPKLLFPISETDLLFGNWTKPKSFQDVGGTIGGKYELNKWWWLRQHVLNSGSHPKGDSGLHFLWFSTSNFKIYTYIKTLTICLKEHFFSVKPITAFSKMEFKRFKSHNDLSALHIAKKHHLEGIKKRKKLMTRQSSAIIKRIQHIHNICKTERERQGWKK